MNLCYFWCGAILTPIIRLYTQSNEIKSYSISFHFEWFGHSSSTKRTNSIEFIYRRYTAISKYLAGLSDMLAASAIINSPPFVIFVSINCTWSRALLEINTYIHHLLKDECKKKTSFAFILNILNFMVQCFFFYRCVCNIVCIYFTIAMLIQKLCCYTSANLIVIYQRQLQ